MSEPREPFTSMVQVNEWLALIRTHEDGITKLDDIYLKDGQRVACYLGRAITWLVESRHLALSAPDEAGMQRVCVTNLGQLRLNQLSGKSEVVSE